MSDPRTIFVLDDDGDFVSLLTEILTQAGYQVQSSTSPEEAITKVQGQHFDLLVIDQRMGQMTGCEFLEKFRKKDLSTPVIVVSGFLEHTSAQQFINLGVSGIFFKPLNIFALLKRVEELFKGLVKPTGMVTADMGIRGFTRTPFGSSASREVFFKKLRSLAGFKGNLLLVGDAESPFITVAEEIVKGSGSGEKLVKWEERFSNEKAIAKALDGAASATIFFQTVDSLSAAEQKTLYKLTKHEAPFESLPPVRCIFCLEQEIDALYEKKLIDDEFYLFLGNLELKIPKPATMQTLHKSDGLQKAKQTLAGLPDSGKVHGRVLVLDDEDIHAQMIVDVLDGGGYKSLKINGAADALLAMRKERFSLIITDFRMPGINGVDFVAQARQIEPSIPIFIVTGNIQVPEIVRIGNMGVTRIIQKPIDIKDFLEEVNKVLAR